MRITPRSRSGWNRWAWMIVFSLLSLGAADAEDFQADWSGVGDRAWAGPDFWANRLQDWNVADERLECVEAAPNTPMRTAALLTADLTGDGDTFETSVTIERIGDGPINEDAAAGLLIGVGRVEGRAAREAGNLLAEDGRMDYRAAAQVHRNPGPGGGTLIGVNGRGRIFAQGFSAPNADTVRSDPEAGTVDWNQPVTLTIRGRRENGRWQLEIAAAGQPPLRVPNLDPTGQLALVSHPGTGGNPARFAFDDWRLSGPLVHRHPDRALGPILSAQYTLHRGVLKLTAQYMPVSLENGRQADFQVRDGDGWKTVAEAEIEPAGYLAAFRIEGWEATEDVPYRVVDRVAGADDPTVWTGTIQADPVDQETIVLAALSCCEQFGATASGGGGFPWATRSWFPHADLVEQVAKHQPDLYFFAGDQIYEGRPTPPVRAPLEKAKLDYLYKWYLWCWAFRDLARDTPCITIPDDHDVFQGNIWGMAGAPARPGDRSGLYGGYGMPAEWVNLVHRTQTSHLPEPFDPSPMLQGISVYYTALDVGGVGFAILQDRAFKSSPAMIPAPMTRDSHITDLEYDIRLADQPDLTLLGDRQLAFLDAFARDWTGQEMKAALSQTIFCNLQISSRGETAGKLDRDLDSNGWPPTGRKKALDALRKAAIIHIAGDQHLASVVHQGIDTWGDAVWSFCVPAIANLYPRLWNPDYPPLNADEDPPRFLGHYEDGFYNKLDVKAVANPIEEDDARYESLPAPKLLYSEGVGYGIIRFHKPDRMITLECWPRHADPETDAQYPGWPITLDQEQNDGRTQAAFLPVIEVSGCEKPAWTIEDAETGELVVSRRATSLRILPTVPYRGRFNLTVFDPESERAAVFEDLEALSPGQPKVLEVDLSGR